MMGCTAGSSRPEGGLILPLKIVDALDLAVEVRRGQERQQSGTFNE